MGKKEKKDPKTPDQIRPEPAAMNVPGAPSTVPASWLTDFKTHAILCAIIAILFYINTYQNEYALDDTVVIVKNEFVLEGFAGIPDILTKDAYYSYYRQLNTTNQLSGGRYRPLSIVTFAIEQQFFGAIPKNKVDSVLSYGLSYAMNEPYEKKFLQEMHIRHFFNVLWYALSIVVLLYFLRYIVFRHNPWMALIAALIFVIHPLHTEVVANVKSRDEIMSLLFICLTFIFAFKYRDQKKLWLLVAALISYFLAFLSKEYAITLVVLLPLSFYIFNRDAIGKSVMATLPYFAVVVVYLLIRYSIIGPRNELSDNDIQINPYAFATGTEKVATEISTALNYLKLLIVPSPLSSDYSYNQIPYKDFSYPIVWLSLAIHLSLALGFFYFFRKRSVLCFAIAFYLLNLLMVCNIIFDIGATMGERLIYHASLGFAIAASFLLYKGYERLRAPVGKVALAGFMVLIIILAGFKTIARNRDWKNDESLFFRDIEASPNSFLVNANVACILVNKAEFEKDEKVKNADLRRGLALFNKVIAMQDNYVLAYMNRSVAYYKLGQADSMVMNLDKIRELYPIHPQLPEMYYHAGMLYFSNKQYARAAAVLQVSLKLYPRSSETKNALKAVNDSLQAQK